MSNHGLDAKFLSRAAKKICRACNFTPRRWEPLNGGLNRDTDREVAVARIWNSKREITITNFDLDFAERYL